MRISVLDQSPVAEGGTPADALLATVELARALDGSGVERFWVAEHHDSPGFAGSAPIALAAALLGRTRSLRIGTGGVLLPRHDATAVAESFRVLGALFPGRVDLGVGRAGGPPGRFPEQLHELYRALGCGDGPGVMPTGTAAPPVWLLGGSGGSAALAGRLGASYCFAHFLGAPGGAAALAAHRDRPAPRAGQPAPRRALAVRVVTADTDAEAEALAAAVLLWRSRKDLGHDLPFPAPATVARHRWTGAEQARAAARRPSLVVGPPERVRDELTRLASTHGVDELVVTTLTHDPADRLRCHRILTGLFAGAEAGVG